MYVCPFDLPGSNYCNRCLADFGGRGTTSEQKKEFYTKRVKQPTPFSHLCTVHVTLKLYPRMPMPALKRISSNSTQRGSTLTAPHSLIYLKQRSNKLNRWQPSKLNRMKLQKIPPFSYFRTEELKPFSELPKLSTQCVNRDRIAELTLIPNFIQPPIPSQQCFQTRLLRRKDPSIILSKELRLHPPRVSVCGLTSHREKTPDNYDEYK